MCFWWVCLNKQSSTCKSFPLPPLFKRQCGCDNRDNEGLLNSFVNVLMSCVLHSREAWSSGWVISLFYPSSPCITQCTHKHSWLLSMSSDLCTVNMSTFTNVKNSKRKQHINNVNMSQRFGLLCGNIRAKCRVPVKSLHACIWNVFPSKKKKKNTKHPYCV